MRQSLPARLEETLRLIIRGYSYEVIAEELKVQPGTIRTYTKRIKRLFTGEPEIQDKRIPLQMALMRIGLRYFSAEIGVQKARALEVAYAQLGQLHGNELPPPAPLPPQSRMPLTRNSLFVGREADLQALATAFMSSPSHSQAVVVTGPGGIGKTQLASEFVHRYGPYFAGGVFWLSFADPDAIPSQVASCGSIGNLDLHPHFRSLSLTEQVELVLQAWRSALPRLLVFDGCAHEKVVQQWQPRTGGSQILVTSLAANWDPLLAIRVHRLNILHRSDSIALLRKFRPDIPQEDSELNAIAAELGDLPLALHLAGHYLREYRQVVSPKEYLVQLTDAALLHHPSLQAEGTTISTGHIRDIARTFAISYNQLKQFKVVDARALKLLAHIVQLASGELIPRELVHATLQLAEDTTLNSIQIEDAIKRLTDLGLLEDLDQLRIHRLLATFVESTLSSDAAEAAREAVEQAVLKSINSAINTGNFSPLLLLRPHLRAVAETAKQRKDERAAALCNALGNYFYELKDYTSARNYYEQALAIRKALQNTTNSETARSLHNLANVLGDQEDYAGAQHYLERALVIFKKELGENHADTANTIASFGRIVHAQKKYAEAHQYYEHALEIRRVVLGGNHPDVAWSLNNLGELFKDQELYAEAIKYQEQALEIHEAAMGSGHLFTAVLLNNLGEVLTALGDQTRAEDYLKRALTVFEQTLGTTHEYTIISLKNLVNLFRKSGAAIELQQHLERLLAVQVELLGENNSEIVHILSDIGDLLDDQGDYLGAKVHFERALTICKGSVK